MRWFAFAIGVSLTSGCASRSTLHANRDDAGEVDVAFDTAPETWAREAAVGPACADREWTCPMDDWGPLRTVQTIFEECSVATGSKCGDLRLVFDNDGCLIAIDEIHTYSPAFVDCVERAASAKRWQCAAGGDAFHMFQSCSL